MVLFSASWHNDGKAKVQFINFKINILLGVPK